MSMLISSFMFIALFAVSIAHFSWAFGSTWPIRTEKLLAQTVVGTAGIERMPPRLASLAVAIATIAAGIFGLALADHDSGGMWMSVIGAVIGLIFLARGIIGYMPFWAALTPEPSFRFNDRRVYSPLCILLGVGFLALVFIRYT
jgi:4-amino-4-deoxy-L-arabinose transferase-like glycosyltransferase